MAESKILTCTCSHAGQDEMYGKGRRLFNPTGKNQTSDNYRCTICGKETGTSVRKK